MGEVRLTLDEYEALLRLQSSERESEGSSLYDRRQKARKRKGKPLRGMKSAMKKAHARAKKKDGSFRKGWDQSRLMSYAHKIRGKR